MSVTMTRRAVLGAGTAAAVGAFRRRARAGEEKVIRIGVLTDMSGAYAANTGAGSVLATQMAAEDFAKTDPGFRIEVVAADMQLKPDVALAIAGDWFDNRGVDVLTDLPLSSAAFSVGEMVKKRDKLAIFTGAASADLTGPKCGPNHLHWAYDTWSMPHAVVSTLVQGGATSWFFITADYAFGHSLQRDSASFVTAGGGTVLGVADHPFPGTTDFSSYLVQARASGAKAVGLANGGTDTVNCIKQAAEFGLMKGGQKVAGLLLLVNDVHGMGLEASQGVLMSEPYYWNLSDATRGFGRRYAARMTGGLMPNSAQAGQYSAALHYLKAVRAMGFEQAKASGRAAIAQMRAIPIEDPVYTNSSIRADGRVIHDVHLFEVKKPSDSKEAWDYLALRGTVPAAQAFRPLADGRCPLTAT
jgi:branched-chain amino acid transport system substrate-binding protein